MQIFARFRANPARDLELLGDVDELLVEPTGATTEEVAQALAGLEDERGFGEQHRLERSPRVAAVRAILDQILDEDDEETSSVLDAAAP